MTVTDFTIIIPTRGRPESLSRLLQSIVNNVSDINNFDVIIRCDNDDKQMEKYSGFKGEFEYVQRGNSLVSDYINPMALKANGKYIWFLADDCEIETEDWDLIIRDSIDSSGKVVFFGDTYDSSRDLNGVGQFPGFPVISRELINYMGFFFDPRIMNWGADKYTHGIYKEAGFVIDMQSIRIKHHQILDDETSKNVQRVYGINGSGSNLDYTDNINRLKAYEHKRTIS